MNATFGYNQHYKQAFLRLEDRRFDITVDIDFHELLVLKNELDAVLDIIK